jgi:hypothetical protein
VHFCNIGGRDAARLQLRTDTVPNCISGLPGTSMMQKCTGKPTHLLNAGVVDPRLPMLVDQRAPR